MALTLSYTSDTISHGWLAMSEARGKGILPGVFSKADFQIACPERLWVS